MNLDYGKLRKILDAMPLKFMDACLKKNAETSEAVGMETRVTRIYDGVGLSGDRQCEWCISRCGDNMTIQEANAKGAFERHPGCGCEIFYTTEAGTQRQTDWTSNTWQYISDMASIEKRMKHNPFGGM